ncbi:MAG: tRNA (5-methylaminomethyl-2-thiouridine)(34)-methyltransferase MnmD [Gammaproteobacteria bacterium]|nr:tRNA (5-methylaminomethyl-2-thiouridine)(34)-methyltransferase MnmD [Gammaproteobacteria bacterium]
MDRRSLEASRHEITQPNVAFVDGRLYSKTYNDFYADADAVGECRRVHISPARLAPRFRESPCFTIFEFGFGAAVNFLTIAETYLENTCNTARLRFISCDSSPLDHKLLTTVVKKLNLPNKLVSEFLFDYPPVVEGIHRRLLRNERIELTLIFADVQQAFQEFLSTDSQGVDTWLLDGFTPDRNSSMWSTKLLSQLSSRTKVGGTVTSFSVAGKVRHPLEDSGFRVERISHTNHKKHTLFATLNQLPMEPISTPKQVKVLGGGFAGTSIARALTRRQINVTLCSPTGTVADSTSGIPVAVLHGRLSTSCQSSVQFRNHAYFFSQSWIQQVTKLQASGAIHIPCENMPWPRLQDIAGQLDSRWCRRLDRLEINNFFDLPIQSNGVLFPRSTILEGPALCRALAQHPLIDIRSTIEREQSGAAIAEVKVLATAFSLPKEVQIASPVEMIKVEGQIDCFTSPTQSYRSDLALIRTGYIAPHNEKFWVGSTYEYQPWRDSRAMRHNLERLQTTTTLTDWKHHASFRGTRAVTSDKLPIIGQVAPTIWLNLGHGSSGTTTAPFGAEIVASQIAGELPPIWSKHLGAVAPDRFDVRQKRRANPFQVNRNAC